MKFSYSRVLFLALCLLPFSPAQAGSKGFEDPVVMGQVMNGEIVVESVIDTSYEAIKVVRSYFPKVSTDAYQELTVNYPKYPTVFDEVQSGTLLSVNNAKTEYTYKLDVIVGTGILKQHVYPEGKHSLTFASDPKAEAKVLHLVTNYKDMIELGQQSVRLIPHETGILVEDTIHLKVNPNSMYAKQIKKEFLKFLLSYTDKLREELTH